jgi:hypothetical protein
MADGDDAVLLAGAFLLRIVCGVSLVGEGVICVSGRELPLASETERPRRLGSLLFLLPALNPPGYPRKAPTKISRHYSSQ